MIANPYVARAAARIFLLKVWKNRQHLLPKANTSRDVLIGAPEVIAEELLGIVVDSPASIDGSPDIAGYLDRGKRKIEISSCFSAPSQRFTFGHELGHWILHTNNNYFRDRSLSAPGTDIKRPYFEIEADIFAAELLIPRRHLAIVFRENFRGPIDGTVPNVLLAEAVSIGKGRQWHANDLAAANPFDRAVAVAKANFYQGKHFMSLTQYFAVSQTAMAIQILEAGLIS